MILLDGSRKVEAPSGSSKPLLNSYSVPLGTDHIIKPLREIVAGDILWDQKLSDYLVVRDLASIGENTESLEPSCIRVSDGAKSWTFHWTGRSEGEPIEGLRRFENIVVLKDSDALLQRRVGVLRREHSLVYGRSSTGSSTGIEQTNQSSNGLSLPKGDHVFSWKSPGDLELGEFVLTNFGWRPVNRVPGKTTIFPNADGTDGWYMRKRVLYNLEVHFTDSGAPRVPVWGPSSTAGDSNPGKLFVQRWMHLTELAPGAFIRTLEGGWREIATVWHPLVRRGLKKRPGHMATVKYPGMYDLPLDLTLDPKLRDGDSDDPEILVREVLTASAARELQKGMTP